MKQLFIIFLLVFSYSISQSQAVITKPLSKPSRKSIKDFGAIPNDGMDDTWAFIKAGKYFSNLWDINGVPLKPGKKNINYSVNSALLEIPEGQYLVGKQINVPEKGLVTTYGKIFGYSEANAELRFPANGSNKVGLELITLSNAENDIDGFIIRGVGRKKPVIKYNYGLVFGYFNSKGQAQFLTDSTYNSLYATYVGTFIYTRNCKNILVENIEINGNNISADAKGKTRYGGGYSNHLIQMGASGTYMINTKNVTLNNLNIHHMTLDGIMFQDYYYDPQINPNQAYSNLLIKNTISNYNRRQGFSWVGGRGIRVENSKFNHTGTTVSGIALGNPAAGLDIEPEKDENNKELWCVDGSFVNCEFINNRGNALVNDITGHRTQNMVFDSCIFHDVDGYAVWVKGKGFVFNNCKIWGGFVHGRDAANDEEATRFNNCDFADEEMPGRPGVYNKGFALLESWNISKKMKFENCSFRSIHKDQRLITLYTATTNEQNFSTFSNCSFTASAYTNGNENILFGCVFNNDNRIVNNSKDKIEAFLVNGIVFTGGNKMQAQTNFLLKGKILFSVANTNGNKLTQFTLGKNASNNNLMNGYVNFIISDQSCVYTYWDQVIDVGSNASFINEKGGQFVMLNGTINNAGKIILENESKTGFLNPITINTKDGASFYYNKDAKLEIDPSWNVRLGGPGGLGIGKQMEQMKMSSNTKFHGNSNLIPQGRRASVQ